MARNSKEKNFCNYYKRTGHVISECRRRPPRKNEQPPRQSDQCSISFQAQASPTTSERSSSDAVLMTPEQIRDMINASVAFAFTSMGILGWCNPIVFSTSISPSWFIDSGASNHMTAVEHSLSKTIPYTEHEKILAANGQQLSISGIGSITLPSPQNSPLTLSNVYFVGQLVDNGYSIHFTSSGCVI